AYLKFATIGFIICIGAINYFGPKHSGSLAVTLAIPTVVVIIAIIAFSVPHLSYHPGLLRVEGGLGENWVKFVEVILALSGVEAIANLTGVMKLDPGSTPDKPSVAATAKKAILP